MKKKPFTHPLLLAGFSLFSLILLMALFGPLISGYSPNALNLLEINKPPSFNHWFGTDDLGRDLFTRVCFGARISLFVGITAAVVDVMIGVFYGGFAALVSGRTEQVMMRFADLFYAVPTLLIVILIVAFLGPGVTSILFAMILVGWITMARIVRARVLQLKDQEFILAAKAFGASQWHILFTHMIPNCLGVILITLTLTIPSAIFIESFLSFLGLGIQLPAASWGTMANEGLPALRFYPWRLLFPASFICFAMLSFQLMGDGLRDLLDPMESFPI